MLAVNTQAIGIDCNLIAVSMRRDIKYSKIMGGGQQPVCDGGGMLPSRIILFGQISSTETYNLVIAEQTIGYIVARSRGVQDSIWYKSFQIDMNIL